jgi:hypothetical protein
MKHLNQMWSVHELGFRPALVDFATMRIYPSPPLPEREVAAKGTMLAGFERGGFFYTRRAVARACQDWRLAN